MMMNSITLYLKWFLLFVLGVVRCHTSLQNHDIFTKSEDPNLCNPFRSKTITYLSLKEYNELSMRNSLTIDLKTRKKPLNCYLGTFNLQEYSLELLEAVFLKADNESLKRIIINLPLDMKYNSTIFYDVDIVLQPRPWWTIFDPTFSWNISSLFPSQILFDRSFPENNDQLLFLGKNNFLPKEQCSKRPIFVGHEQMSHPGWGSGLAYYQFVYQEFSGMLFGIYVNRKTNGFIHSSDCYHDNLWSCYFIPPTNCTFPNDVVSCHEDQCLEEKRYMNGLIFDAADAEGNRISKQDLMNMHIDLRSHVNVFPFLYLVPSDSTMLFAKRKFPYPQFDMALSSYIFNYILRPTWDLRKQVLTYLALVQAQWTDYHPTERCVAVHLRRGDRVAHGAHYGQLNMTEYCLNATRTLGPGEKSTCLNERGVLEECPQSIEDLGCYTVPFGSITLDHVIDKVSYLVGNEIKSLVIASDDPPSVEEEIRLKYQEKYADWSFRVIPTVNTATAFHHEHSQNHSSFSMKSWKKHHSHASESSNGKADMFRKLFADQSAYRGFRQGSHSSILFLASFELVRRCEGFIGHMGSAISMLIFQSMCLQHAGNFNVCPPMYDFRFGLTVPR